MKKLMLFLVLLTNFALINFVVGQQLPTVVDNSKWFQPAGTQYWNSCHVYSLCYLKAYEYNRKYNRDPKLPQNQFSPYSIWNLAIDPINHWMETYSAFNFMQNQGCTTLDNFSSLGESQEIIPNLASREKALSYKSSKLKVKDLGVHTEDQANAYLKELKDSLNKGTCFTLHFPLFKSIDKLYEPNESVYSYENNKIADMYFTHLAVVVGYDDNIVTKSGKGALKILNSWGDIFGDNGYFYLDYNFFKIPDWNFACYFLEEDFAHKTDLYLNVNLSQAVTGEDIFNKKYIFTESLEQSQGRSYDFADLHYQSYLSGRGLLKVKSINKQIRPEFNQIISLNGHNHDGSHKVIADLTDYVNSSSFQTMQVILQDPISVSYVGSNGQVIYSYSRDAKAEVSSSLIKIIGSSKIMIGKVTNLSDTTIIVNDFYSRVVGANLSPQVWSEVYVKTCTSVLKRKLITFSVEDLAVNLPLAFTQVPGDAKIVSGNTFNFKVIALDPESKPIVYSMVSGLGGTIDSASGQFTFISSSLGNFPFTVKASDGIYDVTTSFTLAVTEYVPPVDAPPVFTQTPNAQTIYQNQTFKFQFTASDPENKTLKFSVDPLPFNFLQVTINETTGDFTFLSPYSGSMGVIIRVTDGVNSTLFTLWFKIELTLNTAPVFVNPGTLMAYTNKVATYQLEATDQDNDPLTFSISNSLPEAQLTSGGKLTLKFTKVGTYRFTAVVSDSKTTSSLAVTVNVDLGTATEDIEVPEYSVSIYPNPVSANTSVELIMKKNGLVNLTIYDLQGRQVEVITNAEYEAGKNTISYDASNLRSGTYVCRFIAPGFTKSIKIIKQ